MTAPVQSTAKLKHGKVAWREAGEGSPLIFLHGMAANSREWLPLFVRLSRDFRVIAWDCPGYGGSDPLRVHEPSAHDYAEILAAFLDDREIARAAFVGNWFGGVIAGALAGKSPERIDLLAVTGMKPKPTEQEANEFLLWLQQLMTAGGQEFGRRFADRVVAPECDANARAWIAGMAAELSPVGFGRACHMLAKTDAVELFKIVRAPLFLVYGENDPLSPAAEGKPIERVVRGAITEIVGGAGHMAAVEKPDLFHRTLRACLRTAKFR